MNPRILRTLEAEAGYVDCLPGKREDLDHCRFCAHSVRFRIKGREVSSPARAFCTLIRASEKVDLNQVEAVICDDDRGEGFRSIMNIIG